MVLSLDNKFIMREFVVYNLFVNLEFIIEDNLIID